MNTFVVIKELLKDYDINTAFTRCYSQKYQNDYMSSFYMLHLTIRKSHVVYKTNGLNYITTKLKAVIEQDAYFELAELLKITKSTIKYNNQLQNIIKKIPDDIVLATSKYEISNLINDNQAIISLHDIAHTFLDKVGGSFFEKIDEYQIHLSTLKTLIESSIKDGNYNEQEILNLKSYYLLNQDYFINYKTDLTFIYDELTKADHLIYSLFQQIRSYGVITCDADLYIDSHKEVNLNYLDYTIEQIDDIRYQAFYIFKDKSILVETRNGTFIEVRDNTHLYEIEVEIMLNIIKNEFKKFPLISNIFDGALKFNCTHYNRLMNIAKLYKNNSRILKDNQFNLVNEMRTYLKDLAVDINEYNHLVIIGTNIRKIVKKHKVEQFAYSIASKKYKKLYNEQVMQLMESIYDLKIEQSILQEYIGSTIAAYKDSDTFYSSLKKMYDHFTNFKKEDILKQSLELNTKIVYDNDDILIYEIQNFQESNILGSSSWCISRDEIYFKSYTKNKEKQYFVYNFNHNIDKDKNLIGITLMNDVVKSACYRNNKTIPISDPALVKLVYTLKNL